MSRDIEHGASSAPVDVMNGRSNPRSRSGANSLNSAIETSLDPAQTEKRLLAVTFALAGGFGEE